MSPPKDASGPTVPWWLEAALYLLVGPRHFRNVAGDLCEEHRESAPRSSLWYASQLVSFLRPLHFGLILGVLSAFAILISNIVLPMLHILPPENDAADGLLSAILIPATLVLWGLAGAWSARYSPTYVRAARAGALTAFLHMLIVTSTFTLINNLFLDIVSGQPDKIWGLANSGLPSMRAYVNYAALRAFAFVIPISMAIGAVCALATCLILKRFHPRFRTSA